MIVGQILPLVGKLNDTLCRIPLVGEHVVRTHGRLAARAAFHAPFLGGRRCSTIVALKGEWLKFLARVGIHLDIVEEDDDCFVFSIERCPYGFEHAEQQLACDACMDLDREYIKLLGGELTIEHCIPDGSVECRCTVRLC